MAKNSTDTRGGSRAHPSNLVATLQPAQSRTVPLLALGKPAGKNKPLGSNRLLIVDDEVDITHVIESAARELGFESLAIHETEQFEEALRTIKPTIIFLDISMPRRDGVELIAYLSAWNYPGMIVIMSGHPLYLEMSSTIAKTRGLRLAGLLTKPFKKQQILDLLVDLAARPTE